MYQVSNNRFSLEYLKRILSEAREAGYLFRTVQETLASPGHGGLDFILRIDLDRQPLFLSRLLDVLLEQSVRATIYVRTNANDYSPVSYQVYPLLRRASDEGHEIGLHTSCVEFAGLNALDPVAVLGAELSLLRGYFSVSTLAPHRDINYCYNSLPWLQEHWSLLKERFALEGHAYEDRLLSRVEYLNEGLNPHLGWRARAPEVVIPEKKPICLLIHPHWWWSKHPFEY